MARIFSVLLALPRALAKRSIWHDADLIIARNLEMLALTRLLTRLTGSPAKIAYECLDIHRLAVSSGVSGAFVRAVERLCLRRTAFIITSSPAFERNYFRARQQFGGRIVLAENKVLFATQTPVRQRPASAPWRIAWCGVLRCERSFELLSQLSTRRGVNVELWGMPALDVLPDFHERVAASRTMRFCGRYSPEDLPRIYGAADFSWAADFYDEGANSDWLLPNRLYESLCYGAVPIAAAGVETARWLRKRGVGVVLDRPLEVSLDSFFAALTPETYRQLEVDAQKLEPEATRITPESCRAFAAELAGALA